MVIIRAVASCVSASLLFFPLQSSAAEVPPRFPCSLTLAWDPSDDPNVIGYRVYEGRASEVYTSVVDTSNSTTVVISNLDPGATYYFAVTAYDNAGLESQYSGEIDYTVPVGALGMLDRLPPLTIQLSSSTVVLSGTASPGNSYDVLATQDFQTWFVIGAVAADATGAFQFTDPRGTSLPVCCYRLHQATPP
jgi:fibronectin type 3 domain-containing protein